MTKDTIKVFLRIRPDRGGRSTTATTTVPYEVDHEFDKSKVSFHIDRTRESDVVNHSIEDYNFSFNRVFEPQSTQEQVFDAVGLDCCKNVLDGYNSTVFMYGQTGSGKTFTATGGTNSRSERGLIPRSLSYIFEEAARRKEYQYTIGISFLQLYQDKGSDLLNRGEDAKTIDDLPAVIVNETEDDVILRGLECHPAASVEEALNLLFLGDTNRIYCETPMNKTSSRSHCVFIITVEARQHGSAMVRRSKLNLVDLAGSERIGRTGVSGTIQAEAKYINVSLHYLEQVIVALGEQARGRRDHIPYRNSMMTMVLRDSLGGNCRTAMIATAHPGLDQVWETLSTCRFAQRVASIKTEAFVNEEQDPAMLIRNLKREVAQLKEQVAFLSGGKDADPNRELSSDEMERCRELVQKFLEDAAEDTNLVGAGSDMARLHACFRILKKTVKGVGAGAGAVGSPAGGAVSSSATAVKSQPPAIQAPPTMTSEQEQLLREEVRRLRTSLQMKENELTLLFDLVNRNTSSTSSGAGGGGNAQQQLLQLQLQLQQQQQQQQQRTPISSPAQQQQQQQPQPQPLPPPPATISARSTTTAPIIESSSSSSSSEYNLSALSDPELLKDRTTAFEAFRRSYRKHEQMGNCHNELQERIAIAKNVATEINSLIDKMKHAKSRVQQLRAERALKEDPDQVDVEETQLLQELHETLRPQWTAKTEALKSEKEKIQHLQLLIKKNQEQLIKDFDSWYTTRQSQVSAALNTSSSTSAAASSPSTVAYSVAPNTFSSTPSSSSSSNFTNNAVATNSGRISNNNSGSSNSSVVPKTGNPQVDAELARMYEAREALKQRLSANFS